LVFYFIGLSFSSVAQPYEIQGKVLDINSKEAIPFASIAIKDVYKGTASNALGEFSLKVDSLPIDLVISHLSYQFLEITATDTEEMIVELTPGELVMKELVVQGPRNENFAYDLLRKAYYKILNKRRNQEYGKAFYRQISKNGDEYSELYEIFYDTRYSNNGVEDWAIQEGRYALKLSSVDSFIYNKNFTQMVRLLTVIQPKTEDLIMPISESVYEQFNLTTDRILSVNDRNVAQISFTKKEGIPYPALEGEISIDIDSYEVLKLKGDIADDNLNFISLSGKKSSWKNYVVGCEIAFKPMEEDQLALDYMRLQQNFEYYVNDVFINTVETKSFFTYYEYYEPPKRKKLGGRLIRFNQRDAEVLDAVGYNQSFWDENIIVKRTPVEAEVITSFERERAFGSIYLNNVNQLILEDYEIDNDPFIVHAREQLKEYTLPREGEKVYIHHDKPMYMAGDDLWFRAYVVNMSTNTPIRTDQTLHVELITPEGENMISNLFPLKNGMTHGKIELPKDIEPGYYELVSYTDRMEGFDNQLFFREQMIILNPNDESSLLARPVIDSINRFRVFPEGGSVINKMPAQIGYVGVDKFGKPLDFRGRLINRDGRQVSSIKSDYNGFGSMFVLPQSELDYSIMIMSDDFISDPFPEIKESGYSVMVNNLKSNTIDITIRGTADLEGKKIYLLVISKGVLFDRRIGMLTRGLYKTEIPKSNLPSGMAQLLLVNEAGKVLNKRLVFLNQPSEATVKYYLPKREFRPRERVDMVIEINDENGKNLGFSDISVSVVDRDKISRPESSRNIRSYLNLEYALDYNLQSPGNLFNDYDRETLKNLDFIMLNQQTILPEIESFKDEIKNTQFMYATNNYLNLSGTVYQKVDQMPLSNGYVSIIARPDSKKGSWYVKTDDEGRFDLSGIKIQDSTKVALIAMNEKGKEVSVAIELDPIYHLNEKRQISMEMMDSDIKNLLSEAVEVKTEFRTSGGDFKQVDLSSHVYLDAEHPFSEPAHSVTLDEKYSTFSTLNQLLKSRLPGTQLENGDIKISGKKGYPLIILDGLILNHNLFMDDTTKNINSIPERYLSVPVSNLSQIDIIEDSESVSIFGHKYAAGIIAIYSKQEFNMLQNYESGLLTEVWLPGYQPESIFYYPDHSIEGSRAFRDSRTTLYWNPSITTNRKGRTKISFYNSDEARNMQICVEGITTEGLPIFDVYDFGRNYSRSRRNR